MQNPLAEKAALEERVTELEAQLAARFAGMPTLNPDAPAGEQSSGVAAVLARLGTAPTNWHQATI